MADKGWFEAIWDTMTTPGGTTPADKDIMNRIDIERAHPSWTESQINSVIEQSHQNHKNSTGQAPDLEE